MFDVKNNNDKIPLIVPFTILFIVVGGICGYVVSYTNTNNAVSFIKSKGNIIRIELNIGYDSVSKKITIMDKTILDSVNNALQKAQEIHANLGGAFKTRARCILYKNGSNVEFFIQHSLYNGWMIEVGNKTFSSNYMFRLVESYNHLFF